MSRATVLFDANVLYPAPLRDLLLQLATTGLFRAKWSDDIHREWISALLRNEPWREPAALDRTRQLMDRAVRDSMIMGYHELIPTLSLPDADDRHVLAAAIAGQCEIILTHNLTDFPASALAPHGIKALHPDEFLSYHLNLAPGSFCSSVQKVRARLVNPPVSLGQYLDTLGRQGLVATVAGLRTHTTLLTDASEQEQP